MPHGLLPLVPWIVAAYPQSIFAASLVAGGSSLVLLWAGFAQGNGFAIDGAMLTGIGSIVGLLVGAVISWRNQANAAEKARTDAAIAMEKARLDELENGRQHTLALEKIRSEAREREQERKYQAEKEELDRKERHHDFAGQLNLLNLKLEERTIELERTRAELDVIRRHIEGHDSAIGANRTAIATIQEQAESGQFPAVKFPDTPPDH